MAAVGVVTYPGVDLGILEGGPVKTRIHHCMSCDPVATCTAFGRVVLYTYMCTQ